MILTSKYFFEMSEEEIKERGKIGVFYATDTCDHSMRHVLQLREEVLKDYPDTRDSDMDVYEITSSDSCMYASHTTIAVAIPAEDFLSLRKAGKLNCL